MTIIFRTERIILKNEGTAVAEPSPAFITFSL
jgi:hypothetical protein